MNTTSPPPILDCGDTPLSATASIVSILTFALGLAASYIALQSATRGAPSEIARLVEDLRSTQSEINRVAEYIFDDAHHGPTQYYGASREEGEEERERVRYLGAGGRPPYDMSRGDSGVGNEKKQGRDRGAGAGPLPLVAMTPLDALYAETQNLLSSCIRLFYETDRLLKRSKSDHSRWDPEGLRRRVVFVMNRHKVDEKIQRLAEQRQKLGSVQMSLFMRKSVAQDAMLTDMSRRLETLESRLVGKLPQDRRQSESGSSSG